VDIIALKDYTCFMPKKAEPTGFGIRLKELREAAGLTQDELAERAGLYKFSVAKLEQGVREPVWSTVLTLAAALGVNCLAFVAETEVKETVQTRARGRAKRGRS
jgi:transcriptional regulator with XRE-family HTH domain